MSKFRPPESSFSFSTETSLSFRKTCSSYESPYQELTERYAKGILLSCGAQRSKMPCQDGMVPFMNRLLTQNRRRIEYSVVNTVKGGNGMEAQLMRLQDLRLEEGMSLEQLAGLSGVDHDRLAMFENNPETVRNMHLDTACQIAKALHCNVLELHPDEGWRGGIHCAESGLRDIRRTRGYTQSELSEMTGIPQPNISWFETGYRSTSGMRLDTARRLSEALQCDPTDFLKEAYRRYEFKCCI